MTLATERSTPPVPRHVFCVIEEAHRDFAVADAACAGRFSHHGETLELGLEPDWLAVHHEVETELRIVVSKFYEGLHLAHAFRETGDERYLRAWESPVRSWLRRVPAGHDEVDTAARRVENWVYAWSAFAAAPGYPGLAEGLAEELVAGVAAEAAHIRGHLTPGHKNHFTMEVHALFLAALALPDVDPGGELLDFAMAQLEQNLLAGTFADGVHREASTHYHLLVLQSFLGARENAERFGLRFSEDFDRQLERMCEFALHVHRPDGGIPAVSDADGDGHPHLLVLAAQIFHRIDFLYGATGGELGAPPARRCPTFAGGGYCIQRSGWGERETPFADERFLIFDCGPIGDGGHGHYDVLSFEAAAGGRALLVDPGRYTYAEGDPDWRHWFKGTAAHNTVCVDGADQIPYRPRKPRHSEVRDGRFLGRLTGTGLDVVLGEAISVCYDAVHRRRVAFVAGEYWLVEDRLEAPSPHRYDLRFHLAPEAEGVTEIDGDTVLAPGLALVLAGTGPLRLEDGWVSPRYGIKAPVPVVAAAVDGAERAHFVSLVLPRADGAPVPSLRVVRRGDEAGAPTIVEVEGAGPRGDALDLVAWGAAGAPFELGDRRCAAPAAWLRRSADGEELAFEAVARDAGHAHG
jgi:Heparinase II/III-like protein/Heparinase II/III N-terminus